MLVIRIELWSANSREKIELARMHISNTGESRTTLHNYVGKTFKGRTTKALDRQHVARVDEMINWPRDRYHVWSLVAKMLTKMGY